MNDASKPVTSRCSQCREEIQEPWFVCPSCGVRLKSVGTIVRFSLNWFVVLTTFAVSDFWLGLHGVLEAKYACIGAVLIGVPLIIAFGESLLSRVNRKPLIESQYSDRAVGMTLIYLVVLPVVIIFSVGILTTGICFDSMLRPPRQ